MHLPKSRRKSASLPRALEFLDVVTAVLVLPEEDAIAPATWSWDLLFKQFGVLVCGELRVDGSRLDLPYRIS